MSRFRIDHPTNATLHAYAGHDHALGFFEEVFREGRRRPIKSIDRFTLGRSVALTDIFDFLIEHEFMTREDLEAALAWLQDGGSVGPRSKSVMRVVEIVMEMKAG